MSLLVYLYTKETNVAYYVIHDKEPTTCENCEFDFLIEATLTVTVKGTYTTLEASIPARKLDGNPGCQRIQALPSEKLCSLHQ